MCSLLIFSPCFSQLVLWSGPFPLRGHCWPQVILEAYVDLRVQNDADSARLAQVPCWVLESCWGFEWRVLGWCGGFVFSLAWSFGDFKHEGMCWLFCKASSQSFQNARELTARWLGTPSTGRWCPWSCGSSPTKSLHLRWTFVGNKKQKIPHPGCLKITKYEENETNVGPKWFGVPNEGCGGGPKRRKVHVRRFLEVSDLCLRGALPDGVLRKGEELFEGGAERDGGGTMSLRIFGRGSMGWWEGCCRWLFFETLMSTWFLDDVDKQCH